MKTKITIFLIMLGIAFGCQQNQSADNSKVKKGMIKVTLLYKNDEGKTFDMDYYAKKHMPMVAELLGDSLQYYSIDKGLSGRTAEDPIPYLAIGYLYFDQLSAYQNSFGPVAGKIVGDIPNYTNIQPVVQISEVFE